MSDPTLLRALWSLLALCEDLADATTDEDRSRVVAAITTWLQGHCANCGMPLDRERRRGRALEPLCIVCETTMRTRSTTPNDAGSTPF